MQAVQRMEKYTTERRCCYLLICIRCIYMNVMLEDEEEGTRDGKKVYKK